MLQRPKVVPIGGLDIRLISGLQRFIIIDLIYLTETLHDNLRLVSFHGTISSHFNGKDPSTTNDVVRIDFINTHWYISLGLS